nr:MAG TPA: hypothetical protein [Bacteriophage sp.]
MSIALSIIQQILVIANKKYWGDRCGRPFFVF